MSDMHSARDGGNTAGSESGDLGAFVELVGREAWQARIDAIVAAQPARGRTTQCGRDVVRRHAIEVSIERQLRPGAARLAMADDRIRLLAGEALRLHAALDGAGRARFENALYDAMQDGQSLTPLFHLLRTAWLQRQRGFEVTFAGFAAGAPFDLLIGRGGSEAEIVCDVVSAETGRDLHQGAWFRLVDMIDPELQTWLAAHPGRYLLNMTLPNGLRQDAGSDAGVLAEIHRRIKLLLAERRRLDHDPAVVMRLDPLIVAGARAEELGFMSHLRAQFGPDAHLAVTSGGGGVFVMAAQAGRANDVPAAVHRRMTEIAPARLTGTRPGILAMFVADTSLAEWRRLARDMSLEGSARHFLTTAAGRHVVSVSCTSRHELFDEPDDAAEFRFRNPAHMAARCGALAPSVVSSN